MKLSNSQNGVIGQKSLGGLAIEVVAAPRPRTGTTGVANWLGYIYSSIMSLLKGMKITLGYLIRPSTVVTQQYPENRATLKMFERFRGQLRLTYDDNGYMRCNGCNFCELACPNGTIVIKARRNAVSNMTELDQFVWRLDSCTFCNACIQACPHEALEWSNDFEAAVYDRRILVYGLNKYAGPPAIAIKRAEKKQENVEALKATVNPRNRYEGKVPLAGVALPGVPALGVEAENRK